MNTFKRFVKSPAPIHSARRKRSTERPAPQSSSHPDSFDSEKTRSRRKEVGSATTLPESKRCKRTIQAASKVSLQSGRVSSQSPPCSMAKPAAFFPKPAVFDDKARRLFFKARRLFSIIGSKMLFIAENALPHTPDAPKYKQKRMMSDSEVITIPICYHSIHSETLSITTNLLIQPFVEIMTRCFTVMSMFLKLACFGECSGIDFIDSTYIPVIHNKRQCPMKVFIGKLFNDGIHIVSKIIINPYPELALIVNRTQI